MNCSNRCQCEKCDPVKVKPTRLPPDLPLILSWPRHVPLASSLSFISFSFPPHGFEPPAVFRKYSNNGKNKPPLPHPPDYPLPFHPLVITNSCIVEERGEGVSGGEGRTVVGGTCSCATKSSQKSAAREPWTLRARVVVKSYIDSGETQTQNQCSVSFSIGTYQ